ncbi:hypothetical protein I6U48_00940 [Clostridium sp. PL3]|uniref:Uncharacterized protein n=1 Tax=Clostridium thailandense TaxID=2794346 RepID=A0A949TTA3_9CLOT|nr:hypothetical protein [Clostridium thailandense]MBV7271486.1 hypothetical protein [Clostridium thailandense]
MRKYSAEFGLNMYTSLKTLIPVELLKDFKGEGDYHIYMILSFPRTRIKKDSICVKTGGLSFDILQGEKDLEEIYHINQFAFFPNIDHNNVEWDITNYDEHLELKYGIDDAIKIYNNYPQIKNSMTLENHLLRFNKPFKIESDEILRQILYQNRKDFQMEVLYIGQAYGSNGKRKAQDRLASHSKLQEILTDSYSKYRNRRLMALLLQMTPLQMSTIDGYNKDIYASENEDIAHIKKVINSNVDEKQVINITEAALINYFKPYYNKNFVENFPCEGHKGYLDYYNLDYNCITVELDLEFDKFPNIALFTESNKIGCCWDYIQYNLYNNPKRKNMYDIFKNEI